jgi:hypothetical protein
MRALVIVLSVGVIACEKGNPENSPICGFTNMAGAAMVLEELRAGTKTLSEVPSDLDGTVPARVAGYGTARALVGRGPDGLVLGYEGEGFPKIPGFGLILVEDSLDTFKGVLIYDIEPPKERPQLGTISTATGSIPLYGVRVTWGRVSTDQCPLFAEVDTAVGR